MSKRNADYHDGRRVREATVSKAAYVGAEVLGRVRNRYAQASLRLQVAFGLRRKEALMIQPAWADRGNRLVLHDTWTKGGRPREIPLTTAAQRQALDHAKAVAGQGSLIPASLSYKGVPRRPVADGVQEHRAYRHARIASRLCAGPLRGAGGLSVPGARRPEAGRDDGRATATRRVGEEPGVGGAWPWAPESC